MRKVCRDWTYGPLRDYLDGLVWDGEPRLTSWLTTYCGVDSNEYTSEVGLRWCISAVARGYKPGCKADHMLVMEGAQGRRKSSALAALTGPDWFSDSLPQMGTKDASSYLRGKWVVEVAELEAMRKEVDQIKAFISRQVETFRPAYAREEVSEPRRCIFAGTTNKDDWQKDVTGGRRFWPVKVGAIDVISLADDRDQIWAKAVVLFKAGAHWWLEGEVEVTARAEVAERAAGDDPWVADVERAVEGKAEIAIVQILIDLSIAPEHRTRTDSNRVAEILRQMGWSRDGRFTSGSFKGHARYAPSEGEQP